MQVATEFLATLLVSTLLISPAIAGSPETPAGSPAVAVAAETGPTWTGGYAGLFRGTASGEMYDIGGPYELNDNGNFFGVFAGYRHDFGKIVVGAEMSATMDVDLYQASWPTWEFNSLTDFKAVAGYDLGRALVYVSAGYTTSNFQSPNPYNYTGWNAGIGADFRISETFFVGGEYVRRSLSRSDLSTWTGRFDTLQIRAGVNF